MKEFEGFGVYIVLSLIGLFAFIAFNACGGDTSSSTPSQTPQATYPTQVSNTQYDPNNHYPSNQPIHTETNVTSSSISPDDAYEEGYDDGIEQGFEDGKNNLSHGYNYNDDSDYYGYYETKYEEGYEEGYDVGYDEGKSYYNNHLVEEDKDDYDF